MSPFLLVALAIIAFAAAFHLHWALGGRLGYSVSLPQWSDNTVVMAQRIGWWRAGAAGVALALAMLAVLALFVDGAITVSFSPSLAKSVLIIVGATFVLRAIVPTRWTGFFKTIRTTRWAKYDTWLYSPLFLALGLSLVAVAAD